MKKFIALAVVLALALGAYVLLDNKQPVPELSYISLSGQKSSTQALKGKVVLVNFWATSCSGCIAEMPDLKKLHQEFASKNFETVAVAMSYDPPEYVRRFVADNQLPFFVTLDSQGTIAKAFGEIQLTPTTFLVDKQGNIIKRYVGVPDFREVRRLIQENL